MFLYDTPPCKDCKKRFPHCHPTCKDYKDWKIEHENKRQEIISKEKTDRDIVSSKIRQCEIYRWKIARKK